MKFANSVINNLPVFAFDEIDNMFNSLKSKGIVPIDFGIGDPKDPTPEFIRQAAKLSMDKNAGRGYPIYNGTIEYRTAIAEWIKTRFKVTINPDTEICSAIGAKEVIFNLANAFVEPGDYILMPNPGYPPYLKGAVFARALPYFLNLEEQNHFLPDLEAVPSNVLKRAKLLWLNYPNNPTSGTATLEFLKKAAEFGRKHGIIVINDECYSEIYYEDRFKPNSILEAGLDGVLSINSMSKRSLMTGWRAAWIAGDAKIIDVVKKLKTNIDSGIPYFIQEACVAALADEKHVKQNRERLKQRRDVLVSAFKSLGFDDCTPNGTFYIWQKLPKGISGLTLCKKLLEPEYGIVVTPGSFLTETIEGVNIGNSYLRMALVPSLEDCIKAAEKISKACKIIEG